ncbi:hypothetical protein LINPERPRIM_LOCUS5904 [Linum perenne]
MLATSLLKPSIY